MELKKAIEKEDGTLETLNADGIDSILSHWPMLKVSMTSLLMHDVAHSTFHVNNKKCAPKIIFFNQNIF